jgi:hypothetical protein
MTKPLYQLKIWLKYSDQYIFLHRILSETTLKSIFHFRICIPTYTYRSIDWKTIEIEHQLRVKVKHVIEIQIETQWTLIILEYM